MLKMATERLRQLEELDERTKVPFVMIELTGEADGQGWVEISGKDEYNIYGQLDEWLVDKWACVRDDPGDLSDETKIPFCVAQYKWPGYRTDGEEGLSNMGKATMAVIDLMCGQLSWTLAVVTGGNVGKKGDIRETQIVFKAPHPMNLAVPHMMVELRSAGYIEVCADLDSDNVEDSEGDPELRRAGIVGNAKTILDSLEAYLGERFQAEPIEGHEEFCDRYYKAGDGIFKGDAGATDSNFGLRPLSELTIVVMSNLFPSDVKVVNNSKQHQILSNGLASSSRISSTPRHSAIALKNALSFGSHPISPPRLCWLLA